MNTYFIQASDLLFFKDGRELQAGSEYSAESIFPPMPSSLYGALRSRLINDHQGNWKLDDFGMQGPVAAMVGAKEEPGRLAIQQLCIGYQNDSASQTDLLFPVPSNMLVEKTDDKMNRYEGRKVFIGHPLSEKHSNANQIISRTNQPDFLRLNGTVHDENIFLKVVAGYIEKTAFQQYLLGELQQLTTKKDDLNGNHITVDQVFANEPRMHVALANQAHTAETGKLFTISYKRFAEGYGLVVGLEDGGLLPEEGILRLGGESRPASYKKIDITMFDGNTVRERIESAGNRFKLITTTPAVFERGWIPDGIDGSGQGHIGGCKVKLISAACGRYVIAGGWDLAKKKPKPSYRAVPPGAVYHFEKLEGTWDDLFRNVFGRSVCANENFNQQGYGITYIGVSLYVYTKRTHISVR